MHQPGALAIYEPTAHRVARTMVQSGAYLVSETEFFTWKSGFRAPVYTDCRRMMGHPGGRTLIKKALGSAILSHFGSPDYAIGMAEAGITWSSLVADELHIRTTFVRKQPKNHGVGGLVAGIPDRDNRLDSISAVIVDDLVASGESLVRAVNAVRDETHINVIGIVSIVNWDFHAMRDRFRELRVPVVSLVSYPQLLAAALDEGLLSQEQLEELVLFYRNPRAHQWSSTFTLANRGEGGVGE
ncbi:MAG TPA: hypothetical protein DCQ04_12020 [Actinobacteria bacterium]|nr:hypothetical protein [Actinomycetota bacterium]